MLEQIYMIDYTVINRMFFLINVLRTLSKRRFPTISAKGDILKLFELWPQKIKSFSFTRVSQSLYIHMSKMTMPETWSIIYRNIWWPFLQCDLLLDILELRGSGHPSLTINQRGLDLLKSPAVHASVCKSWKASLFLF